MDLLKVSASCLVDIEAITFAVFEKDSIAVKTGGKDFAYRLDGAEAVKLWAALNEKATVAPEVASAPNFGAEHTELSPEQRGPDRYRTGNLMDDL